LDTVRHQSSCPRLFIRYSLLPKPDAENSHKRFSPNQAAASGGSAELVSRVCQMTFTQVRLPRTTHRRTLNVVGSRY
jgi:hypothetical protein